MPARQDVAFLPTYTLAVGFDYTRIALGMARKLDEAAVRHVAKLARLRVDDVEIAMYATQLASVLDYVAQLDELDTTGVAPTAHPLDVSNVLRDDEIRPSVGAASAMANAPDTHDMFFRVPKVLDQGGA